jgi:outer membrane murein-binding lipoprotein Lpp
MSDHATLDRVIRHPAVQIIMGALVGLLVTISSYTINRTLDGLQEKIGAQTAAVTALQSDLGRVATELTRITVTYQENVPKLNSRVDEIEKSLNRLRWEISMINYEAEQADEAVQRRSRRGRQP